MASALFPCGHVNYPEFKKGSRYMTCGTCGQWMEVKAQVHEIVEYIVSRTNFSPPNNVEPNSDYLSS